MNSSKSLLIESECLEAMRLIPNNSINLILCDLPYGTTQNKWDSVIPMAELWQQYTRILSDGGCVALMSQGVFTAKLILSNEKWFKYKITWIKSKATNFLNAKKQPLRKHEDICIFYPKKPIYNPQMGDGEPYNKGIRKAQQTGSYGNFNQSLVRSQGKRYPTDVVYYKTAESEGAVHHPTQKPVELAKYLIRTYSNEGDVVLDNATGSGSFMLAAVAENRRVIGIEMNDGQTMFRKEKVDMIKVVEARFNDFQFDNLEVVRKGGSLSIRENILKLLKFKVLK